MNNQMKQLPAQEKSNVDVAKKFDIIFLRERSGVSQIFLFMILVFVVLLLWCLLLMCAVVIIMFIFLG